MKTEDEILEAEVNKGQEAHQLLNNPMFKEVMEKIKEQLNSKELTTPTTDVDACVDVIRSKQLFESIERQIITYVNTGKLASAMLAEKGKK